MTAFGRWLAAQPPTPTIIAAVGISCGVSGLLLGMQYLTANKPRTMQQDWQTASKDYMKQYKMNPIFGISSKEEH